MNYQRARLEYQFKKLNSIHSGVYPEFGGNVEFELFSFFEICYQLKDWIKESTEGKQPKEVENFVNASPALRITADICNRLKHKVLRDRKTKVILEHDRSNGPLGPFQLTTTVTIGPSSDMAKTALTEATIQTERGEENCFTLAKECMTEWERYFSENMDQ